MVDGVSVAAGEFLVEAGVDVALEGEHVGGGEFVLAGEPLPDAFVAIGRGPLEGELVGVAVGGDAGVGGGEDAVDRVFGAGHLVEGHEALPLVGAGGDGDGGDASVANGNEADGLIADVALVVGVDHVERWAPPAAEDVAELGPVRCAR